MAITAAVCNSFKGEVLAGTHVAADVYKIALYVSAASLDATTTAYTATNEVANGNGYATLGQTLTGFSASTVGGVGVLDFTTDPSWAASTITAAGALIYNSSKSNKAVAVLSFGGNISSTSGTFNVAFSGSGVVNLT